MELESLKKKSRLVAFIGTLPTSAKVVIPLFVLYFAAVIIAGISGSARRQEEEAAERAQVAAAQAKLAEAERQFNSMTPAEHLIAARKLWSPEEGGNVELAIKHLKAIPADAPEGEDADVLLPAARLDQAVRKQEQEQAEQQRIAEERARREEQQARYEQRRRDANAEIYSYWSTTLRVDTDMDNSWLPDEERTCQTYPNEKGRVTGVTCTSSGSQGIHNIPVKFWGGVDRNTVSNWKCRREKSLLSDEFVCRAID